MLYTEFFDCMPLFAHVGWQFTLQVSLPAAPLYSFPLLLWRSNFPEALTDTLAFAFAYVYILRSFMSARMPPGVRVIADSAIVTRHGRSSL